MSDPAKPRAFRLEPMRGQEANALRPIDGAVEILPEAAPAEEGEPAAEPRRRGGRWGGALIAALGGLASVSIYLGAQNAVIAAIRQSDTLGLIALGLALIAAISALVLAARFLRDLLRERRIEKLKIQAAEAIASRSADGARRVAETLLSLQTGRASTARNRARFAEALPGLSDPRDIIALAERELIEPLDRLAADEIARAARQVSLVTAVSPRALIDILFVVFAGARLIRAVTAIYGGRPGTLGLFRIARASLSHLLVTGGLAAGDAVLQQLVGQGLAARLSAKLGEGVLNGLMTARFGLAALAVTRPLPFVEARPPSLSDVASGLLSGREAEPPSRQP
jgi:putative membrane protein